MGVIDSVIRDMFSKEHDINSKEFMLDAFKQGHYIEDYDPWRTAQDVVNDNMMRYSSLYRDILKEFEKSIKEEDKLPI